MLKKKWRLFLLIAVFLLLLFRVFFYIPVPGFDMEKIERLSGTKVHSEK